MTAINLDEECKKAQEPIRAMPEWVKHILRCGPYAANYDQITGRWYVDFVGTKS